MATTPKEFEERLRAYLASADAYQPFLRSLQSLPTTNLFGLNSIYFLVTQDDPKAQRSLKAFYDLVVAILTQGDKYDALRVESIALKSDTPWHNRYSALDPASRKGLAERINRQKTFLTLTQRQFLAQFAVHINRPDKKKMEKFVYLDFPLLYDCLLAYIEVSQQYEDSNENSLEVFYAMSFRALGVGDPHFAAQYESRVHSDGSVWKRRYDALKSWQRDSYLVPAIKQGKQIVSVIKYGDNDVTEKHPIAVTIPREPAQPEDQRRSQPQTRVQREFGAEYLKFIKRQNTDKQDDEFLRSISARSFEELRQCLHTYLQVSKNHGDDQRSLAVFYLLAAGALTKGDAYYTFKFKLNIGQSGSVWAKPYGALNPSLKGQIDGEIKKKEKLARIVDDLKFAYFQKHLKDPDVRSLRDFEVRISPEQALALSKILETLSHAFETHAIADFLAAFDRLAYLVNAQNDLRIILGLLQSCTRAQGVHPMLRPHLRWYISGGLYIEALRQRPEAYQRGFDNEEAAFLFDESDRSNPYFNDFAYRLACLWLRKQSKEEFTSLWNATLQLHFFAQSFWMRLVPFQEAAAVHGLVETVRTKKPEFLDQIRIPVNSRYSPLRINQKLGKVFIVWWDPNEQGDAYVAIDGFEGILFSADHYWRLGKVADHAIYGEIYKNTSHILLLMPALLEFLSYLPDLWTGGLVGLAKSIVFDFAFEKTMQALGLDPTVSQLIILGGGMLAHHSIPEKRMATDLDTSAVEGRGVRRLQGDKGTPNTHIDDRLISRGVGDGPIQFDRASGPDMRGIKRPDGQPSAAGAGVLSGAPNHSTRPGAHSTTPEPPPLSSTALEEAEDLMDQAEHFEALLSKSKTKDSRYANLESDKTAAFSNESGIPIFSGPGRTGTQGSDFIHVQSRGPSVAERNHASQGVARCEQLSGHPVPRNPQDSFGVSGSYYAHHAEVKDRVLQFDHGTNGMTAVSKPMCAHCRLWHQRVAQRQNTTLRVADPIYIRRFNPDGSVDVFYNAGFPDPNRVGKHAAKIEPGILPSTDKYTGGSAW